MTYYKATISIDFEAASEQEAESIALVAAQFLNRLGESAGTDVIDIEEIPEERT